MKTVINVGIGGRSFTIDEDAYQRLDSYLDAFRKKIGMDSQTNEVMDDVELRIADIFTDELNATRREVVDIQMVNKAIAMLGMPDGSTAPGFDDESDRPGPEKPEKKFYRDPDDKKIAGVCSGLAAYLDVDVVLIRIVFLVTLFCASAGLWIYLVFWIVTPLASTAAQKCVMRGIPVTAGNMKKYSNSPK